MSAWLEEQSWLMDYKPTAEMAGRVVGMNLVMCNKRFHLVAYISSTVQCSKYVFNKFIVLTAGGLGNKHLSCTF